MRHEENGSMQQLVSIGQKEERKESDLTISVLTHQLVKKLAQLIFSSRGKVWVTFPQLQTSKARSNSRTEDPSYTYTELESHSMLSFYSAAHAYLLARALFRNGGKLDQVTIRVENYICIKIEETTIKNRIYS